MGTTYQVIHDFKGLLNNLYYLPILNGWFETPCMLGFVGKTKNPYISLLEPVYRSVHTFYPFLKSVGPIFIKLGIL